MARGISKCKACEQDFPTKDMKIYSAKKYCNECYIKKTQERDSYNALIAMVCECFELEVPTGLILKQIKTYRDEFKYEYDGMNYTLYYLKNIKGCNFETKYGVALLKFEYENAKAYYEQQSKVQESVNLTNHDETIKIIKVGKVDKLDMKNKYLINIDDLLGGDN